MECQVCCETFNKSNHSKVSCYCNFVQCSTCAEKYLLETPNDPHCMNCKTGWNREKLLENFTKKFVGKTFKERRENLLFERERALMPATQPAAERTKKMRDLMKQIQARDAIAVDLFNQQNQILNEPCANDEARLARYRRYLEVKARADESYRERMYIDYHHTILQARPAASGPRREFIRACPADDCRGFLSTGWKCGMCDTKVCPTCHEIKTADEHECKPENVETARLLAKDTRPCPKCASMIFKIDGCFAENTPILKWDGSVVKSQDIKPGDILVGDDGKPRTVIDVCSGEDEMYKVSQKSGSDYIVNSKHKLALKFCGDGHVSGNKVKWFDGTSKTKLFETEEEAHAFAKTLPQDKTIEMSISDYIQLKESTKKHMMGFKSEGVNWPQQDTGIDPYLFGLWLGDGFSNGVDFASDDPEIQKYLYDWCKSNGSELVHMDSYRFHIRCKKGVIPAVGSAECKGCTKKEAWICQQSNDKFESANLDKHPLKKWTDYYNVTNNKHIPDAFLLNDRATRLSLLAGLIDTDGHVANNGKRVSIIQSKEHLSKQIELLSRSLGFTTSMRVVERKNVKVPGSDELKDYGNHYIVNISGKHIDEIPTLLPRKKCISTEPNKDWLRTSITVELVGRGTYYGWSVTDNKRFVMPDMTVLRNCDQMYCTACNTAFSWRTGQVETGRVHNPHYYDYLRRVNNGNIPREPGDIVQNQCGMIPHANHINQVINLYPTSRHEFVFLLSILQVYWHVDHIIIPRVRPGAPDTETLRINYMIGELTEEVFKKELQKIEKSRQKKNEIHDILTTYQNVTRDQLRLVIDNQRNLDMIRRICQEFFTLRDYINEQMTIVSKRYTCVTPRITETWMVLNVKG